MQIAHAEVGAFLLGELLKLHITLLVLFSNSFYLMTQKTQMLLVFIITHDEYLLACYE